MTREVQLSALAIYKATQEKAKRMYGHRFDDHCGMVPVVSYDEVKCKRVYFQSFDVITLSEHGIISRCNEGIILKHSLACMTPSEFIENTKQ